MRARDLFDQFRQGRILGGALVLAVMQFGASLMGLIRDRMLASTFPGLDTVDVYIASFRPSDLCFQMMIMAGFSVALVPLLATYHADKKTKQMQELLNAVIGIASLTFGVFAIILSIVLPWVAPFLVGFEGESLELYINFARLALVTNFLFVFGNAFGQYLITIQRYWIYGLTPMLYTLGTILGTVYLTPVYGAYGPMIGTLAGAVVYVMLRGASVYSQVSGFRFQFSGLFHSDLKEFYRLMWPRMLALGTLQLELLLFDTVASGLDAGSVTINAYTRNFQAVAVGVAGIALAQSAFSLLSQAASKKEKKRYYIYLRKGISILLFLTIPGSITLVLIAPIAAKLVSLSHVLPIFTLCLIAYAISIPFESINHLLLRAFYATRHTITPAIFSVSNGIVAIVVAWVFAPSIGVLAIPVGFTIGQVLQMIGLGILLPRRVTTSFSPA
ncbi:MAG: hypothetical protein KC680_02165 [Candidatus Peregrinibacteria bacterium]|nr:hypothetical protein [Candidatus Peregrinibacteria bacterium]MCB9808396.1 hypothetical protein [Candidatus Peribacteria bacterium]